MNQFAFLHIRNIRYTISEVWRLVKVEKSTLKQETHSPLAVLPKYTLQQEFYKTMPRQELVSPPVTPQKVTARRNREAGNGGIHDSKPLKREGYSPPTTSLSGTLRSNGDKANGKYDTDDSKLSKTITQPSLPTPPRFALGTATLRTYEYEQTTGTKTEGSPEKIARKTFPAEDSSFSTPTKCSKSLVSPPVTPPKSDGQMKSPPTSSQHCTFINATALSNHVRNSTKSTKSELPVSVNSKDCTFIAKPTGKLTYKRPYVRDEEEEEGNMHKVDGSRETTLTPGVCSPPVMPPKGMVRSDGRGGASGKCMISDLELPKREIPSPPVTPPKVTLWSNGEKGIGRHGTDESKLSKPNIQPSSQQSGSEADTSYMQARGIDVWESLERDLRMMSLADDTTFSTPTKKNRSSPVPPLATPKTSGPTDCPPHPSYPRPYNNSTALPIRMRSPSKGTDTRSSDNPSPLLDFSSSGNRIFFVNPDGIVTTKRPFVYDEEEEEGKDRPRKRRALSTQKSRKSPPPISRQDTRSTTPPPPSPRPSSHLPSSLPSTLPAIFILSARHPSYIWKRWTSNSSTQFPITTLDTLSSVYDFFNMVTIHTGIMEFVNVEVRIVKGDAQWVFSVGRGEKVMWEEVRQFLEKIRAVQGNEEVVVWLTPCT